MSIRSSSIPGMLMPFIGRSQEIAEIVRQLDDPSCQLLTVVGPGGMGKTRLALQVAGQKATAFSGGVHFVPLAPLRNSDDIIPAVASAMHLNFETGADPHDWLLEMLRRRPSLLVMDNFEHLLDDVQFVVDILAAAPQVKLLVTSREALNLREEWVRRLDGLPCPENVRDPHLEDYSAVQLFAEYARRIRSDFSVADDPESVVRICRLVEGMPLGIELAAAWLKTLSCARIADEIQHCLDFLESPLRNAPERHRSLRAVFDQSWKLLTPDEQHIFGYLSVFCGSFSVDAALACGASLRGLAALVDKSLLHLNASGRYEIHELLRQYAEERLDAAGQSDDAHAMQRRYFADFMRQRESDLKGRRLRQAVDEITADFDNIRAVWTGLVDRRDYDLLDKMVVALFKYGVDHHPVALRDLFQYAVERMSPLPGETPHYAWGKLLARYGAILGYFPGVYWSAVQIRAGYQEALEIARRYHEPVETGYALYTLGVRAMMDGQRSESVAFFQEALTFYKQANDPFYLAELYFWLGTTEKWLLGKSADGIANIEQALSLGRATGDKNVEGWSLVSLGRIALDQGNTGQAALYTREAEAVHASTGNVVYASTPHLMLAMITLLEGTPPQRVDIQPTAEPIPTDNRVTHHEIDRLVTYQGVVACIEGRYLEGRQRLMEQIPGIRHYDRFWFAHTWGLALAACGLDDEPAARGHIQALQTLALDQDSVLLAVLSLPVEAVLFARAGAPERAVEALALASRYPDITGWMQHAVLLIELRAYLESALKPELFAAAWQRGLTYDLHPYIAERLRGETPRPPSSANQELFEPLSDREMEVLRLIAEGLSNADIAEKLVLTVGTVKVHSRNIYGKLGIKTRTQAIYRAQQLKLL